MQSYAVVPMTEKEKMIRGLNYNALDESLKTARMRAHDLCHAISLLRPSDINGRFKILRELLPYASADMFVTPPFFCDYGWNIHIGKKFYCNTGCAILDGAPVNIGDNVMFGPNVQIYTPLHDLDIAKRVALFQTAAPVTIGDSVWIAGGAIVCPGVTIGEGSVIGAGSVVCGDIPPSVLAVGNPCRVVRRIDSDGQ